MIEGISHLTFIVKDIERASEFFRFIFDAQEVYSSGEDVYSLSREKFFLINNLWIAIMEGESLSERTYNHVAFKINDDEISIFESRIRALGLEVKNPRLRVEGEGQSIYFYDYDNHLFELHTGTLSDRLATYKSIASN
ncbi:MAG TPA: FosX/FosE/FosI family fosfomycin resistance thiol transferase [Desulfitobacterium dehalogenans]|uniref:FosX/FosE/FosI family fosfomycin resistance thiol transferase n=1 Tax=Desulfitobacterium dehalogenans TaxID=36854 RepID=A0A7C6Z246_9FIRM|nr:FosX/FosE/FosI family fosfomycin resistance thiol transferase [Desulfitobacterium dehalogenans]